MLEVSLTPQLLRDFSAEFVHVPCMHFDTKNTDVPFDMLPLAVWLMNYDNDGSMYLAFTGWLLGRGEFLSPDDKTINVFNTLVEALGPLLANADGSINHAKTVH